MSTKHMFQSSHGSASLFLLVRTHSQLQYYLNIGSTRRAANDAGLAQSTAGHLGKVVEIHPISRGSLAR